MTSRAFLVAAGLGTMHAAFSAYWAAGGDWMLASVGAWAVEARDDQRASVVLALAAIAVVKLVAAWFPYLAETGRLPWRRLWRGISWPGSVFLIVYGLANVLVSGAVLLGLLGEEPENREALVGHTVLWGPLFAAWGVALLLGLRASARAGSSRSPR